MQNLSINRRSLLGIMTSGVGVAAVGGFASGAAVAAEKAPAHSKVQFKTVKVGGAEVFYREAGPANGPVVLLLHGFPSSSHMYRDLIPSLSDKYRVIAPDFPGFGETKVDAQAPFVYTFENLTKVVGEFVDALNLTRYALYIFDYGAPVGLRLALKHPERVTAIVSQNGNAYVEGLSDGWAPIQRYWKDPSEANRNALRGFLTLDAVREQYVTGVPEKSIVSFDGSNLDSFFLERSGRQEAQLDLFLDYRTNVDLYPAFQKFFREKKPPLLAIWGKNDPFFLPPGAEAYKRDIPKAEIEFLDTGHFALETHHQEIAMRMRKFLAEHLKPTR